MKNMFREAKSKVMLIFAIGLALVISGAVVFTQAQEEFPFHPNCNYTSTPLMLGWNESFDGSNRQTYCLWSNNTFWIDQPVFKNFGGQWFTNAPADLWTTLLLTEKGNVRNVEVRIEYYAPSYNGVCIPQSINYGSGLYNSPELFLIANHQNGFHETATFDDALLWVNNIMSCDQWNTINVPVSSLQNDFGSSFSGQSKTIKTFGFEMSNIYIRDVKIIGSEQTIDLW